MHRPARKIESFDENKAYYLVLHVGASMNSGAAHDSESLRGKNAKRKRRVVVSKLGSMFRQAVTQMKAVGVTLEHVNISYGGSGKGDDGRFLFRFPRYARRDQDAECVGESFLYAMELLLGPLIDQNQPAFVFRMPADLVRHSQRLAFTSLYALENNRAYEDRTTSFLYGLATATFTDETFVAKAWQIAPILYQHERLRRAMMFLSQSYQHFCAQGDDVSDIMDDYDRKAANSREQTTWENALHNAFKAVEAVIGDPSKKEQKFFDSLRAAGLNPGEKVGHKTKLPLGTVIRDMNTIRDKRSAHGSLADRAITSGEMLEYQECAKYVVWSAIEHELGESIW